MTELGLNHYLLLSALLFGIGVLLALIYAMAWLKPPALAPMQEGRRLLDSIGWAAILPQMLASLGAVFALAGVGDVIGSLAGTVIPDNNILIAVIVFALGMALFTMIMGNAFAAFPVMADSASRKSLVRERARLLKRCRARLVA